MLTKERCVTAVLATALLAVVSASLSCTGSPSEGNSADGVALTLPDGAVIQAEVVSTPAKQQQGLMFRRKLAPERGMLFNFPASDRRPFWMFQTLIPLDIIWMDADGVIVEIAADTPPCGSANPVDCPNYGGTVSAQYVLELAAGQAAAHNLKLGSRIQF